MSTVRAQNLQVRLSSSPIPPYIPRYGALFLVKWRDLEYIQTKSDKLNNLLTLRRLVRWHRTLFTSAARQA